MASLPTITLANHTSILTGRHPGHHGILNNAWYDRATRRADHHQLVGHVARAMETVAPGTESIHTAVHRTWPDDVHRVGATSRATSTPATPRSTSSAGARSRRSRRTRSACPHTTERFVRPSKDYRGPRSSTTWASSRPCGILSGHYRDETYPLPRFMWVQLHPHRLRDARGRPALRDGRGVDPRLRRPPRRGARRGRAGRHVRRHRVRARRRPRHGGERPGGAAATGTSPLKEAGLTFRDEAYGFLYLGVS